MTERLTDTNGASYQDGKSTRKEKATFPLFELKRQHPGIESCRILAALLLTMFLGGGCYGATGTTLTQEQSISFALYQGDVDSFSKHVKTASDANNHLNGVPYLLAAYQSKTLSVFKYLISIGADVNATNPRGTLPIVLLTTRHYEFARALIDAGADIESTSSNGRHWLLLQAVRDKNLGLVKYLIEKGADVSRRNHPDHGTVLHAAAKRGYVDIFNYLVESGMQPEDQNARGVSAASMLKTKLKRQLGQS